MVLLSEHRGAKKITLVNMDVHVNLSLIAFESCLRTLHKKWIIVLPLKRYCNDSTQTRFNYVRMTRCSYVEDVLG